MQVEGSHHFLQNWHPQPGAIVILTYVIPFARQEQPPWLELLCSVYRNLELFCLVNQKMMILHKATDEKCN